MRAHTVSKGFGIVAVIFSLLFFIVPFLPAWLHAGEINASPISISPTDFIRGENTIDCGGNGLRIEAVSVAIDAEPSIIYRGTTSTLSWTSTGAKSAEIDQGIGIVDLHGTLEVSPSKTTTYTITIHWCKGMTTTDSVTIEVLTPEPKPEPTPAPLIITYTVPSDTKLNVAIDSAITAHFSMAINGSTATTNNFKLRDGESDISGSVSSNGTTITFTPSTNLAYDTTYTAIITDGITAANNAGTQLDSEYTWTFTTEKEPPLLEVTIRADPERIILSPGGTNPDNSMPKTIAKRETVTLAWTSANANTAEIDQGIGSVGVNGSMEVSPTETTTYTIIVTGDGGVMSASATITVEESQAIADAGPDQAVKVNDRIMLNGSGSFQQGGDSLTYNWMFTSLPSDSLAFLDDPNAMRPSFTVDVEGEYVVSLVVNNGIADSPPSETFISADNVLPVAYAGPDQTVNGVISLDGSGSFDANGDPLTYRWTVLSKPLESLAVLDNPTDVMPTLITDVSGDFIVGLVVHDGLGNSASDKVVISVGDVPPLADAGPDQPVTIGETVSLDGSGSSDANGDALTYKWTLVSRPFGSNAALDNPTIMAPVFTADVVGDYVAMLIVHDGKRDSLSDSVVISTNNIAPIADAGNSQSVVIGDLAMLEGSGSSDANNDLLDFHWTLTSLPSGSGATLHSPNDEKTSFIPDLPGIYVASLVVDDGVSKSKTDTITISAVNLDTAAIRTLRETIDIINELDASYSPEVFENPNTKKMLTNKLNAVINNIENGEYESALHKMEYELLEKTDGCVLRGEPDKNDWIRDFDAQADVYTLMREAIELL